MLSVGYGTNDPNQPLSLAQARNYWYHWYMATPRGERVVREEREAFARQMWDTWAPAGWYDPADFDEAARAFQGEDWAEIVLHSYRHRWGFAEGDPAYAEDEARLNPAPVLSVPTLVLHGGAAATTPTVPRGGKRSLRAATSDRCSMASATFRSGRRRRRSPRLFRGSA